MLVSTIYITGEKDMKETSPSQKRVQFNVVITPQLKELIEMLAKRKKITNSELLRQMVFDWINK